METDEITNKQQEILHYLYTFRFLHTNHLQKLLKHKDKKRVKEWLKDLAHKGYIYHKKNEEESFIDRTKPYIYCLDLKARKLLKKNENYDVLVLNRIYKDRGKDQKIITLFLLIADMYLFFLSQKESDQEIDFFTGNELVGYDYFPEDLPAAYISITTKNDVQRYFLDIFPPYTPAFVLRKRISAYLTYADSGDWEANTDNEPLPSILFVCPSKSIKAHIYFNTKAKFEEVFEKKLDLYLTTWDILKSGKKDVWKRVNIADNM